MGPTAVLMLPEAWRTELLKTVATTQREGFALQVEQGSIARTGEREENETLQ